MKKLEMIGAIKFRSPARELTVVMRSGLLRYYTDQNTCHRYEVGEEVRANRLF